MKSLLFFYVLLFSTSVLAQERTDSVLLLQETVEIRHIHLYGNNRTQDKILLRELSFSEGQMIRTDSLSFLIQQSSERLASLGLFTSYNISIDTISKSAVDFNIQVKERWYIIPEPTFQLADRNFNVWWNEQNHQLRRIIIGVVLRHKNFRGDLENLNVTAQIGYTKKFGIEYLNPYLDKSQKHGFGVALAMAESQETFYATDSNKLKFIKSPDSYILKQYEASVAYTYRPAYASRHTFRLGYKYFHISDTVAELNADYFRGGSTDLKMIELSYRYELNRVDNWNYPLKGSKLIFQWFTRFGLEGMQHQSFATIELGKFYNPFDKWYYSFIFRGRLSLPDEQPYAFNGALGTKFEYVRGYEYYVVDGSHYGILRFDLKREILNVTIKKLPFKYLPVIPVRVYPKLFADAGYVSNQYEGNSFLNNKVLYSVGVGIDIFTAYDIKIRLEYAWNHLGQKDLFLHFNSE